MAPFDLQTQIDRAQAASRCSVPAGGHLSFTIIHHKGAFVAVLQPVRQGSYRSAGGFANINNLEKNLSIEHQQAFLFESGEMCFGDTVQGVPCNGIYVAAYVLEQLSKYDLSRLHREYGQTKDREITIYTNVKELHPDTFHSGLCRILVALAKMDPPRQIQDLPIVLSEPIRVSTNSVCNITGIMGCNISLRICPNSNLLKGLTDPERNQISEVLDALRSKIPKRPKSNKKPFETMPTEIIQAIAEYFMFNQLIVGSDRDDEDYRDDFEGLEGGWIGFYIGNPHRHIRPELTFFQINKRLRAIGFDRTLHHTKIILHSDLMDDGFTDSLKYLQRKFGYDFFTTVQDLTCCMVLPGNLVDPSPLTPQTGPYTVWFGSASVHKFRKLFHLLALRQPLFVDPEYSVSRAKVDKDSRFYWPVALPYFEVVFDTGSLKTKAQIAINLPQVWAQHGWRSGRRRILEQFRSHLLGVFNPMMSEFTRDHNLVWSYEAEDII